MKSAKGSISKSWYQFKGRGQHRKTGTWEALGGHDKIAEMHMRSGGWGGNHGKCKRGEVKGDGNAIPEQRHAIL